MRKCDRFGIHSDLDEVASILIENIIFGGQKLKLNLIQTAEAT